MKKSRWTVGVTMMVASIGFLVTLLLPVPENTTYRTFHIYFGMAYAAATLFIGSSIVFVQGLGAFKAGLRRAYILSCVGFTLLGLSMFELPVLLFAGTLDKVAQENGVVIALPFIAALIILLVATIKLARLFAIKNIITSWWLPLVLLAILVPASFVLPHPTILAAEKDFDASVAAVMVTFVILGLCALHVWQIRRVAGHVYTQAMTWLALAFGASFLVAVGGLAGRMLYGDDTNYAITAYTLIPLFPAGLLLLRAAYAFNRITDPVVFDESKHTAVSSVDIVVYAAQLTSNPRAIDDITDGTRAVTARLPSDGLPTPNDDIELMRVYLEIEDYLINKEPVRRFSREGLRQEIATRLGVRSSSIPNFWSKLEQTNI
jgi:hypothetical protein